MTKFRNLIYLAIGIPGFIILIWLFAFPDRLIKTTIEDAISANKKLNIHASIRGFKKGLFFSVTADSFELNKGSIRALIITDISCRINPFYLLKKQFAFSVRGKIGTGEIDGFFRLPVGMTLGDPYRGFRENGSVKIDRAEIDAIPYLHSVGIDAIGSISANLSLKNNIIDLFFKTTHLKFQGSPMGMPLPLNLFNKIQGAINLQENTIKITSISLEGDKGYARIKGEVTNGFMHLTLELMPATAELKPVESMLISKYQISPGYYVIPIEGPLL